MFRGSIVAVVTPFMQDEDRLDERALRELIGWHIEEGTEALVLGGTTGEGALLSFEEKERLFAIGAEEGKGKIGLIASTGAYSTMESVALTKKAKKVGIEGALVVIPPYVKATVRGLVAHFNEIARVGLPLILYHHPGRTGAKLSAEVLSTLCALEGVIGMKDSSADVELATDLIKKYQIPFFSGDDPLAFVHLALGAVGTISVLGNVIPRTWKEMVQSSLEGNFQRSREVFFSLHDLCSALFMETNPQGVKYALSLLGKCTSRLRLPLVEPTAQTKEKIALAIELQKRSYLSV